MKKALLKYPLTLLTENQFKFYENPLSIFFRFDCNIVYEFCTKRRCQTNCIHYWGFDSEKW